MAKLPFSFFDLHAKNDRYAILLSWYLAIMLRVNRKYGFSYHVRLRTVLDGIGISVPARNTSRFLAAIYRAFEQIPDVAVSGPALRLYSAEEILASRFAFTVRADKVPSYAALGPWDPRLAEDERAIAPPDGARSRPERAGNGRGPASIDP